MKVFWADSASRNRREIIEYIALDDLRAAIQIDEAFERAAELLSGQAMMGVSSH